jgi:two-component system, OmpR family, sensor kinase
MQDQETPSRSQLADGGRLLDTLESLLALPSAELTSALTHACDLVAAAVRADKVDAFLYDPPRASLAAIGSSSQPLSALQRSLGLDVLAVANGGRLVGVYENGETFVSGQLEDDEEEVRGIRESLKVRSVVAVPLQVGPERRGVLAVASQQPRFFSAEDVRFIEIVVRWVGMLVHRAELVAEIARNALEHGRRAAAEELVTVLAHDLRAMLNPIGFRLSMMQSRAEEQGRSDDAEDAKAANAGLQRLARMINNILDSARIERGMFYLDRRPVALVRLCRELARLLATPGQPVEVIGRSDEELMVEGDRERLSQALENIVSNAIQYSPRNTPVELTLQGESRADGPWVKVVVRDEGPGIATDVLPRIFDRFSSGQRSAGLGLGLYLAKQIAVAHGGSLTVESTMGQGAWFTLELPACRPPPVSKPES